MDIEKSEPAPGSGATPGTHAPDGAAPGQLQSVDRAITVLKLLADLGSASVSRVADELGVHKSTASRLLSALEEGDLVLQNSERGKYRLGFGILHLAQAIPARLNLVTEARAEILRLAENHRETVNLAVLRDGQAVNLDQEMGPTMLGALNWLGSITPLHATSSGKVLLAALPSPEREAVYEKHGLPAVTGRTITSRPELERQLIDIAAQGYATVFEEFEIGLNGIAVPVRDHRGAVIAAVSIAGPAFRFTEEAMQGLVEDLKQAGQTISRRMGYIPDTHA
ncbi:IclR family transcriptional regulator [Kocuria aegyptia]|uniref:IclR family transcriptional regulator n=1 Tax=Kocuria aegyptia TaxID=330943 RepID=A0ABN2KQ31_9MICC